MSSSPSGASEIVTLSSQLPEHSGGIRDRPRRERRTPKWQSSERPGRGRGSRLWTRPPGPIGVGVPATQHGQGGPGARQPGVGNKTGGGPPGWGRASGGTRRGAGGGRRDGPPSGATAWAMHRERARGMGVLAPPRPPRPPPAPGAAPRVRTVPRGSLLTGTVVAVHGEVVRPPLVRDVVARDVGDRERPLPRAHPVVPVQLELLLLYLGSETVSWRVLCLRHRPPGAHGRPARPPPGSPAPPPPPPTQRARCGGPVGGSQPRAAGSQEADKRTGTRRVGVRAREGTSNGG